MDALNESLLDPMQETSVKRLGIRHLFLLTTCTAVAFAVNEWLVAPETRTVSVRVAGFAYCLIYGGALTGLCIFLSRHLRGEMTLRHPGHLLLVFAGFGAALDGGVELAVQMAVYFVWHDLEHVNGYQIGHVSFLFHQLIGYGIVTLISAWLLTVFGWSTRWTAGFAMLWMTFLLQFVTHLVPTAVVFHYLPFPFIQMFVPEHSMTICSLICVALFANAIIGDRRNGELRDWLHWCGLLVALLLAALEWFRYVRIILNNYI